MTEFSLTTMVTMVFGADINLQIIDKMLVAITIKL